MAKSHKQQAEPDAAWAMPAAELNDEDGDWRPQCEAFADGPDGEELCTTAAVFTLNRVADTSLDLCAEHLGPVLAHAQNIEWPMRQWSSLDWIDGERPPNSYSPAQAAAVMDALYEATTPRDPERDGFPAKYPGACTGCQKPIAVDDHIYRGRRTADGRSLWICQSCRDSRPFGI